MKSLFKTTTVLFMVISQLFIINFSVIFGAEFDGELVIGNPFGANLNAKIAQFVETKAVVSQTLNKEILSPNQDNAELTFDITGEGTPYIVDSTTPAGENPVDLTASASGLKMTNEFIGYVVGSNGKFTIGTTNGNPNTLSDDKQRLLYGYPNGLLTSYSTIQIDGANKEYSANSQKPVAKALDMSNTSTGIFNKVSVKQIISIVPNASTGRNDTVQIKYILVNNDAISHNVGVRIMLDTTLGSNDYAPFRVAGVGSLSTSLELKGENIPQYWQAFNRVDSPTIISQGAFTGTSNDPDRVQFLNWGIASTNIWINSLKAGYANTDSAVNVYWDARSLASGESFECVTYYGLGEFEQNTSSKLNIGLTGTKLISAKNGVVSPFTATTYVNNSSSSKKENITAKIILQNGLKLVAGQSDTVALGSLNSGAEAQCSWEIEVEPDSIDKNLTYSVVVSANGVEDKSLSRSVKVPALLKNISAKNAVFETTIPNGCISIDAENISPVADKITLNLDGSTTLSWNFDKILMNENKQIKIICNGKNLIADSIVKFTENSQLSYYDRNNKLVEVSLSDLSARVSKFELKSDVLTDKAEYIIGDEVSISNFASNLTEFNMKLFATVEILDENNNLISTIISDKESNWTSLEQKDFSFVWDTKTSLVGNYKARVTWLSDGKIVSSQESEFAIIPDGEVNNLVATNKVLYTFDEKITIINKLKNTNINKIETDLFLNICVINEQGQVVKTFQVPVSEIKTKSELSFNNTFNASEIDSGSYKIITTLLKNSEEISSSFTNIIIAKKDLIQSFSGDLTIKKQADEIQNFDLTIQNTGEKDILGANVRIRIYQKNSLNFKDKFLSNINILTGETIQMKNIENTNELPEGSYIVVIDLITANGDEFPLANSEFIIERKNTPPNLTDNDDVIPEKILPTTNIDAEDIPVSNAYELKPNDLKADNFNGDLIQKTENPKTIDNSHNKLLLNIAFCACFVILIFKRKKQKSK